MIRWCDSMIRCSYIIAYIYIIYIISPCIIFSIEILNSDMLSLRFSYLPSSPKRSTVEGKQAVFPSLCWWSDLVIWSFDQWKLCKCRTLLRFLILNVAALHVLNLNPKLFGKKGQHSLPFALSLNPKLFGKKRAAFPSFCPKPKP